MGRPIKQIDKDHFEKLCGIMCTLDDISGWFDCSPDTIERWCKKTYQETFADVYKKKSSNGKVSLRRKQYEIAMQGNVTLLIWLGKQHLGQMDKLSHLDKDGNDKDNTLNVIMSYQDKSKRNAI